MSLIDMKYRVWAFFTVAFLLPLSACGGKTILEGDADQDEIPQVCVLPPPSECPFEVQFEIFDIRDLSGDENAEVLDVEVLPGGDVVVAGFFGLVRRASSSGEWERIEVPDAMTYSLLQLKQGEAGDLWAVVSDGTFYSSDGGLTWVDVPDFLESSYIHYVNNQLFLGRDNVIGIAEYPVGPVTWYDIPALNGDHGDHWDNNLVCGIAFCDGWYVAVERQGRSVRTADPTGSWEELPPLVSPPEEPPLRAFAPELLKLHNGYLLVLSAEGSVLLSCDAGVTWSTIGNAESNGVAVVMLTQVVQAADGTLAATGSPSPQFSCDMGQSWISFLPPTMITSTYDVSPAPDGSVWATGPHWAYRLSW